MIIDYQKIIDDTLKDYKHPCDAEIPAGYYRRVCFEKYSSDYPAVGEEWETEFIKIGTQLYTKHPFGLKSSPLLPIVNPPDESGEEGSGTNKILVSKIGYYFNSQTEIDAYIDSIGATKLPGNDWYGADLNKSSLFKHPKELEMYKIENSGGVYSNKPMSDKRQRIVYNKDTGAFTDIDFYWNGSRIAYMRHVDDEMNIEHKDVPCMYAGMRVSTNPDLSIPPIPETKPNEIGSLPEEFVYKRMIDYRVAVGCVPVVINFPYNDLSKSILSAWGTAKHSYKLFFDMLTGLPQKAGEYIDTMYTKLSMSAEEIGSAALALSQQVWQTAINEFKVIISAAMNIVGGAWDMIKRFLPKLSIMGVEIDILDLVFSSNAVQSLKDAFDGIIESGKATVSEIIDTIYSTIGSSYTYFVETIKIYSRDLVDAITDLFDWCITMFQNGAVALCNLLGEIAQIWSMPPEVPNPLWSAILAVRKLFEKIPPLSIIIGGNFPGFTASDIYDFVQKEVKVFIQLAYEQINALRLKLVSVYNELEELYKQRKQAVIKMKEYLNWMYEHVTDEATAMYQKIIDEIDEKISTVKKLYDGIQSMIEDYKNSISDTLAIALEQLKKFPLIQQLNEFLSLCGASIESLFETIKNSVTGAESLYDNFVDGVRSFKDICKTIYNQISTLALSKVTQWVNKLLQLIGLNIIFPSLTLCIPVIKYE